MKKRLFDNDTSRENEEGLKLDQRLAWYFARIIDDYKEFDLRDIQALIHLVIDNSINEEILKRIIK